ncbi:6-carboxytetrahydropterin synthase QueD [Candidatus Gracilibacteria bacterium]|nr:6-carboxytetrahydropterin synthase QueD [Candidatus Gracilibacteria bacterium]
MQITKIYEWDMGHRIPNHTSQCSNIHGHRYKIEITLEGDIIDNKGASNEGMIIDFGDIKKITKEFIDSKLDHGYMGYKGDVVLDLIKKENFKYIEVDFIPTAENIAVWIFNELSPKFQNIYGKNLKLHKIKLYETPNNFVSYEGQ